MTLAVLLAVACVVGAGVYLMLSRDLFRVVVGLSLLGAAVNLIVLATGRLASTTPPVLEEGVDAAAAAAADPLAQAMVLTALVISFALLCVALLLGARLRAAAASDDVRALRTTEPESADADKPTELEW